jgi:uncharacterized membrane protein
VHEWWVAMNIVVFRWKYSISSSLRIPFTSLHFTSFITFLTLFLVVLGLEGTDPKTFTDSLFQSWMDLFTNEYIPISILCLLFLIFQS